MYHFNIVITERCNAYCSHCYMNANNKNNLTLDHKQVRQLIGNLPDSTASIVLTGGEVYVERDLLYYILKQIKEKFPFIVVGIETNGKYFYENEDKIPEEFKLLKELGVSFIRFSDDIFHEQGGIDLKKVRDLKKYNQLYGIEVKYLVQNDALPIGRAKKLESSYQGKRECMNSPKSYREPYLFMDINGNLYTCAWKCIPSVGNILKDSFSMIELNLYKGIQKDILKGNICAIIKGKKYQEIREKKGTCMSCFYYFNQKEK